MDPSSSFDEKKILTLLSEGSEFAFIQLFDKYRPKIYIAALKYLQFSDQAEEIVQEIFMEVWYRREQMTKVININAYLHTMVRNMVYDMFRKASAADAATQDFIHATSFDNQTERMILETEYSELLSQAVEQLPDRQKEIFHLAKEDGLSHEAIAQRLGMTRMGVKAHMKRALRAIRLYLEPHLGAGLIALAAFWS